MVSFAEDYKFRCSPEKFARAVKNGLTPNIQELNLSREQYKKDFGVEFDDKGIPWIMTHLSKIFEKSLSIANVRVSLTNG